MATSTWSLAQSTELEREAKSALEWLGRIGSLEGPQPGSPQAIDDAESWEAVTTWAWTGLAHGTDHLSTATEMLTGVLGGPAIVHPHSPFTLLRTALVGGGIAVWILSPKERLERQARALRVANHDHEQRRTFLRDTGATAAQAQTTAFPVHSGDLPQLDEAIGNVRQWLNRHGSKTGFEVTGTLMQAARAVEGAWALSGYADRVARQWRLGSGGAHSLVWHIEYAEATEPIDRGSNLFPGRIGSPQAIPEAVETASRMLKRAWELWDDGRRIRT